MKKLHKLSGYQIEVAVTHHRDINKFGAGVVISNHEGMKTNRMTTDPTMYNSEKEAEDASFRMGEAILARHNSGKNKLDFDQHD
ncbi:MAG: hypothetical protein HZB72_10020 [Burkholderiales bacterium]|nr:hypothetical protein [Burkholderiales bacterium]